MASKTAPKIDQQKCTSPSRAGKPNSKQCGQCDHVFKKNQKSMNCCVCAYWFCLDCSHVSVKLYDTLSCENTPNLPFNCDGCLRLLPKLNEIGTQLETQRKKLQEYEVKIKTLENDIDQKVQVQVEKAIEMFREREERKCNVIMHNIPEATTDDKKKEDREKLESIFTTIECDEVVPKAFVRLGRPGSNKPRLLKVMLDSVSSKHRLLGGTKLLRRKNGDGTVPHGWGNIYITPDLTKEERDQNRAMRTDLEMRKKDENNQNLVIYRGKIVDRKDIQAPWKVVRGGMGGNQRFPGQTR